MIDFMVIALPRSGTTWAANWLTTEKSLCLHDPLLYDSLQTLDDKPKSGRLLGVSDTTLFLYGSKLNKHKANKVIIHRKLEDVNESLAELGVEAIEEHTAARLNDIEGLHVEFNDLFENPKPIWDYLFNDGFDNERHAILKQLHIQPAFERLEKANKEALAAIFKDLEV